MQWNYEPSKIVLTSTKNAPNGVIWMTDGIPTRNAVIFVDFDGTLVEFAGKFDYGPMIYKMDVVEALKSMAAHYDANVVIVTNQMWSVPPADIQNRLATGMSQLRGMGLHVAAIYASVGKDFYRKPLPGMAYKAFGKATMPAKRFMVGDAAGRPANFQSPGCLKDHSAADYEFALNIDADFYTPETLVECAKTGKKSMEGITSLCKDLFAGRFAHLGGRPQINNPVHQNELVMLCGVPGSGKTEIAKSLEKVGYLRFSGDEIRGKFMKALGNAAVGKPIVCDRTHYSIAQRTEVVEFAKSRNMHVRLVVINESIAASRAKMKARALLGGTYVFEGSVAWRIAPIDPTERFTDIEYVTPAIDLDVASPEFLENIRLIYGTS